MLGVPEKLTAQERSMSFRQPAGAELAARQLQNEPAPGASPAALPDGVRLLHKRLDVTRAVRRWRRLASRYYGATRVIKPT
jgi:hypothetical protein